MEKELHRFAAFMSSSSSPANCASRYPWTTPTGKMHSIEYRSGTARLLVHATEPASSVKNHHSPGAVPLGGCTPRVKPSDAGAVKRDSSHPSSVITSACYSIGLALGQVPAASLPAPDHKNNGLDTAYAGTRVDARIDQTNLLISIHSRNVDKRDTYGYRTCSTWKGALSAMTSSNLFLYRGRISTKKILRALL
jgi:hypothetical protein